MLESARGSRVSFIVSVNGRVVVRKPFGVEGVVEDELSIEKSSGGSEELWSEVLGEEDRSGTVGSAVADWSEVVVSCGVEGMGTTVISSSTEEVVSLPRVVVASAEKSLGHRNPAMGPARLLAAKDSTSSSTAETGCLISDQYPTCSW